MSSLLIIHVLKVSVHEGKKSLILIALEFHFSQKDQREVDVRICVELLLIVSRLTYLDTQ